MEFPVTPTYNIQILTMS